MTDRQSTHSHDCWGWGPKHYECAVREVKALRAEVVKLRNLRAAALDLAIANAAIVDEIREIVGLKGKPGDVVEVVRELTARLGDIHQIADAAMRERGGASNEG